MKLPKLDWQQATVLVSLVAGVTAVLLFAPPSLHTPIAALGTALAGWLRSPRVHGDTE